MLKKENKGKESFNSDLFLYDEEEESFDQITKEKNVQKKDIHSITKGKLVVKFNRKVVYKKCSDEKKLGEKYHLTYKFVQNETKLIKKILEGHGFEQVHPSSTLFNLMWTSAPIKPFIFKTLLPFQRVNHFPKSSELTRKDRLYKNIEKMQQEKGSKHFHFIPTTFVLPNQLELFKTTFEREKGIWIVKPIASSQGRGIFLINNVDDVPKDENVVVSRYIANPLLIDGYKFDIRMYVAVTSFDPLVIYLYREGLTRFATVKYDRTIENLSNNFMHLTNYSVNKESERYVRCENAEIEDFGNKWTMSAMLRLLKSEGKDTFTLMMSIEDLIIKTFLSVQYQISNACQIFIPNKSNCFELYGFDILVDDQFKPWLIEVNLSPSLNCDAPIDLKVKSELICDLLNLISLPCLNVQIHSLQSESMSRSNDVHVRRELNGLSIEQIRLISKLEEENSRSGCFIRIYPSSDTFQFFSNYFHEEKRFLNEIIHQKFFPNRWKKSSFNSEEKIKQIRVNHLQRSKCLSSSFHLWKRNDFNQRNFPDLDHALQRYHLYHQTSDNNIIRSSEVLLQRSLADFTSKENSFSSSSLNQFLVSSQKRRIRRIPLDENERIILKEFDSNCGKKRLLRVSSAPKQEYQRKFVNHSRFSRSSRAISTILQHKTKTSGRLSSSLSSKGLSNDEENQISSNEGDFVDQLNELSSKQHRRQYSAFNHLNNLPKQSLTNNEEKTIILTYREEEKKIIQKPNQMIEQIQMKNEQLAKQAKLFQRKLERNEIYSAVNRYSHRSSINPQSQKSKTNEQMNNTSLHRYPINS